MTPDEHRILLDSSITTESFAAGADLAGWKLIAEHEPTELRAHELVYSSEKDPKCTVHYVEDTTIMVRYAGVVGPDCSDLVDEVRELFDHETDEHALSEAERDREDLQQMVDWLLSATALREQAGRKRLVKLVEKRLAHSDRAIRRAALLAASWLEWPEFRATVERLAEDEPDADARREASRLAEAYGLRDQGRL